MENVINEDPTKEVGKDLTKQMEEKNNKYDNTYYGKKYNNRVKFLKDCLNDNIFNINEFEGIKHEFSEEYTYFIINKVNLIIKINNYDNTWKIIGDGLVWDDNCLNTVPIATTIAIGDYIYCIPYEYNYIIKINTDTDTWEYVGDKLSEKIMYLFNTAIRVGTDIYCIPNEYKNIVIIDTITETWKKLPYDFWKDRNPDFVLAALLRANTNRLFTTAILIGTNIYCIPYGYPSVIKIDTKTNNYKIIKYLNKNIDLEVTEIIQTGDDIICYSSLEKYGRVLKLNTVTDTINSSPDNYGTRDLLSTIL